MENVFYGLDPADFTLLVDGSNEQAIAGTDLLSLEVWNQSPI